MKEITCTQKEFPRFWNKKLGEFDYLYVQIDTLLLADVFNNF